MPSSDLLSIVIPLLNEEANVRPLVGAVRAALDGSVHTRWELILVDDGSTDRTAERIRSEAAGDSRIRLVSLARNYGQSTAMQAGFDHANGQVLVTMDGDLQNDPADIPTLVGKLAEGYDLVAGYRLHRKDKLVTRRIPSWIANRIISWITGVPIRDNGCSLKVYRRELLDQMRLYSDMHRFIPALATGTSGARIAEVPVRHHPRTRGNSKYGLSRVYKVLADLLTVILVRSARTRPLVLAGTAGVTCLLGAGAFALAAALDWTLDATVVFGGSVLVLMTSAFFLLMLGLVAEAVVRHHDMEHPLPSFLVRELE